MYAVFLYTIAPRGASSGGDAEQRRVANRRPLSRFNPARLRPREHPFSVGKLSHKAMEDTGNTGFDGRVGRAVALPLVKPDWRISRIRLP